MFPPAAAGPFWRTLIALSFLLCAASIQPAHAQVVSAQAEIKTLTGRVEVLRRGQTQWRAATVGAKLAESDEIRTASGASAELELPDTTNILVAENTRFAVTKLAVDRQNQSRLAVFHLSVGKVRAAISQPAIQLVRARQSNFAISTPGGVAATRGTTLVTGYDPATATTLMAVLDGQVLCGDFATRTFVSIPAGAFSTISGSNPCTGLLSISSLPLTIQNALTTSSNPGTANSPALQGPSGQQPSFRQVASTLVTAAIKASPGDATVIVQGVVGAAPELSAIVVAAAVGVLPGQAAAFVSVAIQAGGDPTTTVAAAIAAGGNAAAVTAAARATSSTGTTGVSGTTGTTSSPSTLGRNQQVCASDVCS